MAINTRAIYFYNANRQLTKRGSLTYNSGTNKYTYSASEPNINKDQIGTVQLAVALPLGTLSGGTPFMTVRTTKGYLTAPLVMSAASWNIIVDTVETQYQVFYLTLGIVSTTFVAGVNAFMVGYLGNGVFTPLDGSTYTVHDGVGVYEELDTDKYEEIYTLIQANFVDLAGRLTQAESDIDDLEQQDLDFISGATIVEKAKKDQLGNIIDETYATKAEDASKIPLTYIDTDGTLSANSDTKIASQKATKTYADTKMSKTGNETINGVKTFLDEVVFDSTARFYNGLSVEGDKIIDLEAGTADTDAVNKGQMDTQLALKENKSEKGAINGYAPLDANQKLPLLYLYDSVLGQLEYAGVFDASTGSYPTQTNALETNRPVRKGDYFITQVAGTVDYTDYNVGDWAVFGAVNVVKIDNTDAVASVNGKLGVVVLDGTDIQVGSGDTTTLQAKIVSIDQALADIYRKSETYSQTEFDDLIASVMILHGVEYSAIKVLDDGGSETNIKIEEYDLVIAQCVSANYYQRIATEIFTPANVVSGDMFTFVVENPDADILSMGRLTKGASNYTFTSLV